MKKSTIAMIFAVVVLLGMLYQNSQVNNARAETIGRYKSNIYHLQVVNDIMLSELESGKYSKETLNGFSNRCIDLGTVSHYLGLPANNYYNRLESGFKELADSVDAQQKDEAEELTKEMTFLLESLRDLYVIVNRETEGSTTKVYKKLYISMDINQKAAEHLVAKEKSYYK